MKVLDTRRVYWCVGARVFGINFLCILDFRMVIEVFMIDISSAVRHNTFLSDYKYPYTVF